MSQARELARKILGAAGLRLSMPAPSEIDELERDLRLYGQAYYRINLDGEIERVDPMKIRIRQPWDKPRE